MLNEQNIKRLLKARREKGQVTYKCRPIRIPPNFSMETLKVRRAWKYVFQTLRDCRCQPRLIYTAKLLITVVGEEKTRYSITKLNLNIYPQIQAYRQY